MSANAKKELKLCQYADDMAVFLKGEEHLSRCWTLLMKLVHNNSKGGSIQ